MSNIGSAGWMVFENVSWGEKKKTAQPYQAEHGFA